MKKRIAILILLVLSLSLKAQNKSIIITESDRDACFLYAEAESPVNPNVKVLIVSSYIYRKKYKTTNPSDKLSNASWNYFEDIDSPFAKKLEEITNNERVFISGIAKDIVFDNQVVKSYKDLVYAEGQCPITAEEILKKPFFTSTNSFSKDCRARFISAKRKEGYHVFQVAFDEYYKTRDSYDQLWTIEHHKLVVDQVEKLLATEVEIYRPGVIKNLPNYRKVVVSDYKMPALIVTSSSSSGNSSNSSTSRSKSKSTSSSSSNSSDYSIGPLCSSYISVAEAKYAEGSNFSTVTLNTWNELIDAVDKYQSYGCPVNARMEQLKSYAISQNAASAQAIVDVVSGIGGFFGMFNWEFKGTSSTLVNTEDISADKFDIDEVSLNLIAGTDGIRFAFSPISFSRIALPGYKKYYEDSNVVTDARFTESTFYTPSISLRYHFMSGRARKNPYRRLEFPLAVQINAMLFPRNKDLVLNNPDEDDKFGEYLNYVNFYTNASFGANFYFSDGFGIGISGGGTYVGIKESEFLLAETNDKGVSKDFKIKLNDAKKIIPNVDFKILVRF